MRQDVGINELVGTLAKRSVRDVVSLVTLSFLAGCPFQELMRQVGFRMTRRDDPEVIVHDLTIPNEYEGLSIVDHGSVETTVLTGSHRYFLVGQQLWCHRAGFPPDGVVLQLFHLCKRAVHATF